MNSTLELMSLPYFGNMVSVIGIVITIVGFIVTTLAAVKAKNAANSAKEAADKTRSSILGVNNIIECTTAIASLEEAHRLVRLKAFALVPDRLMQAKKSVVLVKYSEQNLPNDEHKELQAILGQITVCEKISCEIDTKGEVERKIINLKDKISELIPRIMAILAKLEVKRGTRYE
jgi:hypothetical protein